MKYAFDECEASCLIETYIINYYETDAKVKKQNIELLSKKLNLYGRYRYPDRTFDEKYRNVNGMDLQLKIVVAKLSGKYRGFKHSRIIEQSIDTLLLQPNYFILKLEELYQYDYSSIGIDKTCIEKNISLIYKFVKDNRDNMNEEMKIKWEDNSFDVQFSRPTKLIFRQNEITFNNSWRTLYREFILNLLKEPKYSEELFKYKDASFFGARMSLFNSYKLAKDKISKSSSNVNDEYDCISNDLYLFNKLSAENILSRIHKILNLLSINTDDVEIYYLNKNESSVDMDINDTDEEEDVEVLSYDENEKRFKNFVKISKAYTGIVYPILSFMFDDGNILYSIRQKDKTTYLYKFSETKDESVAGVNIDFINRLIEIISEKRAIKKTILYFEDGYIENEEIVYNEDFRTHINDLYDNYYNVNRDELIVTKYDDYIDNVKNILTEDFNSGFRLNDALELMNFNSFYNAKYCETIVTEDDPDEFYKFLTNKFIKIDDKIYVKEVLITDDIQSKVNEFITNIKSNDVLISRIDNDKEYILTLDYFMNVVNLNSYISKDKIKKCIEYGLLDNDNLDINVCYQNSDTIYLMITFDDGVIDPSFRMRKSDLRDYIDDVISNYLKIEGICVSYKEICEKLKYINEVDIKKVISRYTNGNSNRVIYDATGFKTSPDAKKYFYISSFPLSEGECREINNLLLEKAKEGWQPIDLKKCIEKNFSSFSYKLSEEDFHNYAIQRCIDILLGIDKYSENFDTDDDFSDDIKSLNEDLNFENLSKTFSIINKLKNNNNK